MDEDMAVNSYLQSIQAYKLIKDTDVKYNYLPSRIKCITRTLRALSIYVASPVTSPENSATLIYVIKIASRRFAFH